EEYLLEKYSKIEQLQCNFKLDKDIVYKKHKVLTERSSLGKNVSSIHSNGLFDANGNEFIAEDTNKNMAFSKVVGKAVLEKFDFRRSFLLANYTPNGELVLKCCRLGIPIIVSTRTPLNSAVEISNKYNITLTELNSKLKVYSAPMRIN
ncbi:MAG: formate dehydrogenase accessory sulfurtransferase FdhD, partial [Candidatus Diapherotrites archaeon]|nr:formate dehydrogenase accessory sulfurtransferase FdhD [Candidatus Diapherotrites archaeon]